MLGVDAWPNLPDHLPLLDPQVETIGDAFMCCGGAPEPCKPQDAAARVARMALEMLHFVDHYTHTDGRGIGVR